MQTMLPRLLSSAIAAWLAMMVVGVTVGLLVERQLGHVSSANLDEYLVAFLIAMSAPFALAIAAIYLPIALSARRWRAVSPARVGAACAAAAPLAGLMLLVIGTALWGAPRRPDALQMLLAPGVALAVGGPLFGMSFASLATSRRGVR
jgi:hypothetical protein